MSGATRYGRGGTRWSLLAGWLGALLVVLGLVAAAAHAAADGAALLLERTADSFDLAGRVQVLADPDRAFTIDDVHAAPLARRFAPLARPAGGINFGFTDAAYWLRFDVRVPDDAASGEFARWFLEVGYPSLDRVEVYVGAAREPLVAGDRQPFAQRPLPHRNLVFPLLLRPGKTTTVTMRVHSEGSLTLPLVLWQDDALAHHDRIIYAALALYYGALAVLLLYSLVLYAAIRDRSYLEYALFLLAMAIGQLALDGFGNQFVWPGATLWGHLALPVGFALCGLFAALFTRSFLATRRTVPWLDVLLRGCALLFAAGVAALLVLPYRQGAAFVSVLGPAFAVLAVACGVRCRQLQVPGAGPYLAAWSLMLVGTAVLGARERGWLPTNDFTTYAMQIGSALAMLLLSFALAQRISSLRRERTQAQAEALSAQQDMVETLRQSEQTLALQVAQRTRELEDAHQRLLESEQRLHHLAHHDPLTGLANRLLLDDRIAQAITRATRHNCRTAVLLVDLDAFKAVNDRLGHAVGDQLLTAVAGRLRGVVRAEDTVARLGGDEFVIVLEDVFETEDIKRVSAGVVTELARPFQVGEHRIAIGATVGFALSPEDGGDGDALLKFADKAMYRNKERVRNLVGTPVGNAA